MHLNTVSGIRKRLVCQGLEAALNRQPQAHPSRTPNLDGAGEIRVLVASCGEPPPGQARWSLRVLADRVVELGIVESFSHVKVSGGRSKKRTQAASASVMGDSARIKRGVCGADGSGAGYLLLAR